MDDRYAINLAKAEIRDGFNTSDVDRILLHFAVRYADLSAGLPSFGGEESKPVLRERLLALFAAYTVTFVPLIMNIALLGPDAALQYGWHELTLQPHTGSPATHLRRRYLELWRRQPDGHWRITLFIDNADHTSLLLEDMLAALQTGRFDPGA